MLNNVYFCFMDISQFIKSLTITPDASQIKAAEGLKYFSIRRLTLKECLPELPPKTFYTWVEEGLIPNHFGKDTLSELSATQKTSESYKGWNRFTVYEFFWIRLVYHLRQAGYPKESIKKNASLFFIEKSPELLEVIFQKFAESEGEFQKRLQNLVQKIGEKSAQHEIEKILQFIVESTTFTEFHYNVIEALLAFSLPYFVATGSGHILTKHCEKLSDPFESNYGTFLAIPYSIIIHDLVLRADKEYLRHLFGLDEKTGMVISEWKSVAIPQKSFIEPSVASRNKWLNGSAMMETIFGFCNQIAAYKSK